MQLSVLVRGGQETQIYERLMSLMRSPHFVEYAQACQVEEILQQLLLLYLPLDGVYLDLHGAMVTESHPDGEGELLRRVRAQIGSDIPLVASLDLHANISADMCEHADYLAIFRTYPHLDMAETGARCVPVLARLLRGERLHKAFRTVPYLIPLHAQYTGSPPFSTLYGCLPDLH